MSFLLYLNYLNIFIIFAPLSLDSSMHFLHILKSSGISIHKIDILYSSSLYGYTYTDELKFEFSKRIFKKYKTAFASFCEAKTGICISFIWLCFSINYIIFFNYVFDNSEHI